MKALVLLAMIACADPPTTQVDAGATDIDAATDTLPFDFYGEACSLPSDPLANQLCHDDDGFCVAGTCRPQCHGEIGCAAGTLSYLPGGGCYCAP